jgi:leader peptidase (prepilin peptidase)/N-methyltransferase
VLEVGTAILFAATAALIGARAVLPAYLWFAAVVMVLVVVDLDHKRIPNRILYPGTVVALVLLSIGGWIDGDLGSVGRGLLGGAGYFAFLLVVALAARGGFGMGDVKFGFLLGLFTAHRSWEALAVAVVMAFLVGGVISMVLLVLRRAGRRDTIPFGPSLAIGAAVGLAAAGPIVAWYLP